MGAFDTGFGFGQRAYNDAMTWKEKGLERERQARMDALGEEKFGWERARAGDDRRKRDNELALDKIENNATQAGVVQNNLGAVVSTDASGQVTTALQPDEKTAENAISIQRQEEGSTPTATAAPATLVAQPASSVGLINGKQKLFTGLNAATEAANWSKDNQGSGYASHMALVDQLTNSGIPGARQRADAMRVRAKEMRGEGVMEALTLLNQDKPEDAKKIFNSSGAVKIPDDQQFQKSTVTDPVTKVARSVWSVVDANGNTIVPDVSTAARGYLIGYKDQVALDHSDRNFALESKKVDNKAENDALKLEHAAKQLEAQGKINEARALLLQAQAARAEGAAGGKPIGPNIVTVKTENGEYLFDKNSGAIGTIAPGKPAVPGKSNWLSADVPEQPAQPQSTSWVTADGQPLPKGPFSLYQQLPVNKADPGSAAPATPSAPARGWDPATGNIVVNGKVVGTAKTAELARSFLSSQAKPAPAPAAARPAPAAAPKAVAPGRPNVDKQGKVIRYPGDDKAPIDSIVPAVKETASNVAGFIGDSVKSGSKDAFTRYLQDKIDRNDLNPMERQQAIRAGLITQ